MILALVFFFATLSYKDIHQYFFWFNTNTDTIDIPFLKSEINGFKIQNFWRNFSRYYKISNALLLTANFCGLFNTINTIVHRIY